MDQVYLFLATPAPQKYNNPHSIAGVMREGYAFLVDSISIKIQHCSISPSFWLLNTWHRVSFRACMRRPGCCSGASRHLQVVSLHLKSWTSLSASSAFCSILPCERAQRAAEACTAYKYSFTGSMYQHASTAAVTTYLVYVTAVRCVCLFGVLVCFALPCFACFALLCLAVLCFALLCFALRVCLRCFASLYLTRLCSAVAGVAAAKLLLLLTVVQLHIHKL